jgi:chromosome segregation protein
VNRPWGRKRSEYDDLTTKLRASDERRLQLERELDPLRQRITDFQLKEQAARLGFEQYSQLLADAQADLEAVARSIEADGRCDWPACKPRSTACTARSPPWERSIWRRWMNWPRRVSARLFLDAQSADLNEAMATRWKTPSARSTGKRASCCQGPLRRSTNTLAGCSRAVWRRQCPPGHHR